MANLSNQSIFVALNVQMARVEHLAGVLFDFVVVVVEPLKNNDQVLRELSYLHIN